MSMKLSKRIKILLLVVGLLASVILACWGLKPAATPRLFLNVVLPTLILIGVFFIAIQ